MPVKGLTQAEIDEATRAQVAAGGKSTDRANRLPGETATEANARITAAYKQMTAKPIISQAAKDAGVQVKFVRTGAGGVGENMVITPIGYTGPKVVVKEFTPGVIPANATKITGTSLGFNPDDYSGTDDETRIKAKIAKGEKLTPDEQAFMDRIAAGYVPKTVVAKPVATKKYTSAELQKIVAKLNSGGALTDEEKTAIGVASTPTPTPVTAPTTATKTADQTAAYNSAKELAQSFVDSYGGKLSDYFDTVTGKVTSPSRDVINKKFPTPVGKKEVSRVNNGDGTFTVTYDDKTTEIIGTKKPIEFKAPVGTPPAYVYDPTTKTWVMPDKPEEDGNWVFDANKGWVDTTIAPGSSGMATGSTKTLALDTFKNTLALLFGAKEASQPWVTALYTSASKFYNTGSTIDESINLSLQDIRFNKELKPFTDRFKGIYALTDRLASGEAIEVPTVAEYFKSESSMGDILRAAGMGELATQDFLGDIIGRGKSVLEVTNLITDTFDRIDNAPSALKADLLRAFPGADRASIAKAMLTGVEGAAELTKKVKAISVQSAAKTQGITINDLTSQDIAAQGYDYNKSLQGFATVAQTAERGATLGRMSGIDLTQQEAIASAFGSNAAADEKLRKIREEEANRFSATSGRLASQNRTAGLI